MKKLLVTGARGFIGRHCLQLLDRSEYEVHAVGTRPDSTGRASEVQWHHVDLLSRTHVHNLLAEVRPSHLLHLAWFTVPGQYWTAPENTAWLEASTTLFHRFVLGGGQRIVGAGTCAEYMPDDTGACSEFETTVAPASSYGIAKHAVHQQLTALLPHLSMGGAWGRIFQPYGPCEHPSRFVPSAIVSLLRGRAMQCTQGDHIRDFIHVADVAGALVALLTCEVSGPVNIGSGDPKSVRSVASLIGQKLGMEHLLEFGAIPTRSDEPVRLAANVGRLQVEVGWRNRYSLSEGLDDAIEWWRLHMDRFP